MHWSLGMTSVSVVIATYSDERWNELVAAIESVKEQSFAPLETIVVVDRNPSLLHRVRRLLDVVAIENLETPGLGGARNSGVMVARGSVVAFLDDDALAGPDWLERLRREYENEQVLGVGGSIEPRWAGGRPRWFPDEFAWVVGCTYRGMPTTAASVRNLIGCNMSFRRDVLRALGGFRLGYGCDETDFCIRVRRLWPQGELRYVPEAKVVHLVPPERSRWRHFRRRCFFEGGSKAVVSWLDGRADGLASERTYAWRTLPRGVARGIEETAKGDVAGIARAAAIVAGLGITAGGYAVGRLSVTEAASRRGWTEVQGAANGAR
jgi:glucosyl-dolichyl phosphate glucuronosyltransferase